MCHITSNQDGNEVEHIFQIHLRQEVVLTVIYRQTLAIVLFLVRLIRINAIS